MKLTINELKYIVTEASDKLLLEISNNAIETILKRYNPSWVPYFNMTLEDVHFACPDFNVLKVTSEELEGSRNLKLKDYLRLKILNEFNINRNNGPVKYIRGIMRISCDNEINRFENYSYDEMKERKYKTFRNLINYIYTNNIELSEDLDGMSFTELNKKIGVLYRLEVYNKWKEGKNKEVSNRFGDYTVVRINSHNDAARYSGYTSWCVTQRDSWYQDYAGDGSQFYFCLKDGFEDVAETTGEGCPLDEYGLSMVSVCVRPNGEPKVITTRWNHSHYGENNPRLMTLGQVEDVLGIPASIFTNEQKPKFNHHDISYLKANTDIDVSNLIQLGVHLSDDCRIVECESDEGTYYNVKMNDEIMLDEWYPYWAISSANPNITAVWFGNNNEYILWTDKYGIITSPIKCIRSPRVIDDDLNYFIIRRDRLGHYNIVNRKNEPQLSEDVKRIRRIYLNNDYLEVKTEKGINLIDKNFNFIWNEFLDSNIRVEGISEGIGVCEFGNDMDTVYIDIKTGKRITEEAFYSGSEFKNGLAMVKNNEMCYNMLNRKGKLLFDEWYNKIERFSQVLKVFNGKSMALFNYEGELMGKWWYNISLFEYYVSDGIKGFSGGIAHDIHQEKKYIIGVNGNILSEIPKNYTITDIFYIKNADRYIIYLYKYASDYTYLNVLNSDGTFVFDEVLVAASRQSHNDNVIECYTLNRQNRKEYDIDTTTGEIIEVEG